MDFKFVSSILRICVGLNCCCLCKYCMLIIGNLLGFFVIENGNNCKFFWSFGFENGCFIICLICEMVFLGFIRVDVVFVIFMNCCFFLNDIIVGVLCFDLLFSIMLILCCCVMFMM